MPSTRPQSRPHPSAQNAYSNSFTNLALIFAALIVLQFGLGSSGTAVCEDAADKSCLGLSPIDMAQPPSSTQAQHLNVLGKALKLCGQNPVTGYFRDGYCRIADQDRGVHAVCSEVTETFLTFTKARGNDLSSPAPHFGFPGLRPGDRWCLCAARWLEAAKHGAAPPVLLEATHRKTLDVVPLEYLQSHDVALGHQN